MGANIESQCEHMLLLQLGVDLLCLRYKVGQDHPCFRGGTPGFEKVAALVAIHLEIERCLIGHCERDGFKRPTLCRLHTTTQGVADVSVAERA